MDAHDLFKKLSHGIRFNKSKIRKTFAQPELPNAAPVKVKDEVFNAAEEWMKAGSEVDSEEEDATPKNGSLDSASDDDSDESDESGSDSDADSVTPTSTNLNGKHSRKEQSCSRKNSREDSEDDDNVPITLLGDICADETGKTIKKNTEKKKKAKLSAEEKLKAQEEEKINVLRKKLRLSVSGGGVPPPIESFDELKSQYNVSQNLVNNLRKAGYSEPTPIQAQAWPIMLQNRQILACAPTGSGKTAAFLLPLLHHLRGIRQSGIGAVIVSPTRELAKQTHRECVRLAENTGLKVDIISKVKLENSNLTLQKTNKFDILITTPNRLVFLLQQEPPVLSLKSVQWLIVDESDKLFEAGIRGFRDQLAAIYQACDSASVKRGMFSATHGAHVAKWCKQNLKGLIAVTVGHRNTATDKVQQELIFVGNEQGKLIAMREMISKGLHPPVLVFVQSKERAKELFTELLYDGINVEIIHSDRTQLQRDNVVKSFREGKIWVLICTELMGRGIDFKGVNLVINYDFPPSAVSYIHRIGRTGRAGREGRAITFFTVSDAPVLRSIATVMKDSGCDVPQYMLEMKKVSKKTRKEWEKHGPERESVSTVPKNEKLKEERLRKKIQNSKRKKKGLPILPENSTKAPKESGKKRKAGNTLLQIANKKLKMSGKSSQKKTKNSDGASNEESSQHKKHPVKKNKRNHVDT